MYSSLVFAPYEQLLTHMEQFKNHYKLFENVLDTGLNSIKLKNRTFQPFQLTVLFLLYYVFSDISSHYSIVYPINDSSTSLAQSRPSRIAHTTNDWPLCISPAVNTFGTLVAYFPAFVATLVYFIFASRYFNHI